MISERKAREQRSTAISPMTNIKGNDRSRLP